MKLTNDYYELKEQLEDAETREEIEESYRVIQRRCMDISMPNLEWSSAGNAWMELENNALKKLEGLPDAEQK